MHPTSADSADSPPKPAPPNPGSPEREVGQRRGGERRTWTRFRIVVASVFAVLVGALGILSWQTRELEQQVERERRRVAGLGELLLRLEGQALTRGDLELLRDELRRGLVDAGERVSALEAGSAAVTQVIARSSASIALVQGRYGVRDPKTRRSLRFALTKSGEPIQLPDGRMAMTLEGSGPKVETRFIGTAFVVGRGGLLLTNRHVALPWEDEPSLAALRALGLEPVMNRLRGYLPGANEPFELRLIGASEQHDIALLQGDGAALDAMPLALAGGAPAAGDTAILLGFPTGIRALLARAGDAFVNELKRRPNVDDDAVAHELARAQLVKPLASRGIVGQVSDDAIVYDAQTTSGGSGGPVLNLKGEVIAINRAILPEFGGSNIGVPARHAIELVDKLGAPASAAR